MTKVEDPILMAWERTRANNRDRAAIFDSQGKVARTFLEIEDRAHQFADELEKIAPGTGSCGPNWESSGLAIVLPGLPARNGSSFCRWNKRSAMSKNRVRWKSVWQQL